MSSLARILASNSSFGVVSRFKNGERRTTRLISTSDIVAMFTHEHRAMCQFVQPFQGGPCFPIPAQHMRTGFYWTTVNIYDSWSGAEESAPTEQLFLRRKRIIRAYRYSLQARSYAIRLFSNQCFGETGRVYFVDSLPPAICRKPFKIERVIAVVSTSLTLPL